MRTIFMVNGYPCSGKTTAANELAAYLADHGRTVTTFNRTKSRWEENLDVLSLVIYKWFNEGTEYLIIDAPAYSVFDRMDLFNLIRVEQEKKNISDDDLLIVALTMSRSMRFCLDHNNDPGHHSYEQKPFNRLVNTYQQPIAAEGFDMVYRISTNERIDPGHLFRLMQTNLEVDFGDLADIPETPAKADDADKKAE